MARKELVQAVLTKFANYVIQQARTNLTRNKRNSTGDLYNSLSYDLSVGDNSFSLSFKMEDYGEYQDKGVKGAKSTYQSAAGSPYKYTNKMPPASAFSQWVVKKGLDGVRNKKGQFVKRKSLQFALARSIYEKGIPATKFFSTPFGIGFKRLPAEIVQAFQLTEEDLKAFTRK
jgi:hypothetical protein